MVGNGPSARGPYRHSTWVLLAAENGDVRKARHLQDLGPDIAGSDQEQRGHGDDSFPKIADSTFEKLILTRRGLCFSLIALPLTQLCRRTLILLQVASEFCRAPSVRHSGYENGALVRETRSRRAPLLPSAIRSPSFQAAARTLSPVGRGWLIQ